MKTARTIISALLSLLAVLPLHADGRLRERVYISTDRDVYVSGDRVWMSAFCVDASTGELSSFSRTAYLEVHGAGSVAVTARIALDGGRGAGLLTLPTTLPTGNYRIIAYTALQASEKGLDATAGGHTISVFNTLSTVRAEGGVRVTDGIPATPSHAACGPLELSRDAAGDFTVTNKGTQKALFCLSVRHMDAIPAPTGDDISVFTGRVASLPAPAGFDESVTAEYEGEVLRARVTGASSDGLKALEGKYAFLSSPGDGSGVYSATIKDGRATFFTSNIYGARDMFLEIEGVDRDNICHLELESPFRNFDAGTVPSLDLCPEYSGALELRSLGMQLEQNFDADTLYTPLPANAGIVFDRADCKNYILDDYTRFPVMEEVFTEFIPELRVRSVEGRKEVQVRALDPLGNSYFTNGTALVLLDGIPVLDQSKILGYDPLLVERIDIYPGAYFLGIRSFRGVVNFVTYKGNLEGMQFEDNVRIVAFDGCAMPQAYTCEGVGPDYPDWRQTLYWHPLLVLSPGESFRFECKYPMYDGSFELMAEGLTESGAPVRTTASFNLSR